MRLGRIRIAVIVGAATLLAGCGVVPPMVSVISYAIDGVSLFATGKSVTDHALSAAAERDCALWRVFTTGEVCREYALTASTVPVDLSPAPERTNRAANGHDGGDPVGAAAPVAAPKPVQSPAAVKRMAPAQLHYLVLASFRDTRPAEQLAAAHGALGASVKAAEVDGQRWYRVVSGPASLAELTPLQSRLGGVGLERPWILSEAAETPRFETLALALTTVR
jgi:hypothetical protein